MTNRKNIIKITKEAVVWALVIALTLSPLSVAAEANYNAGQGTLGEGADHAIAIGTGDADTGTVAKGQYSVAVGASAQAGAYSSAYGNNAQAGVYSSAYGYNASATGSYSSAVGYEAKATGKYSSAFGFAAQATAEGGSAFGEGAKAEGKYSSAYGFYAQATGESSSAFGYETKAAGYCSSAYGIAQATGGYSSAYGGAEAKGQYSAAYGWIAVASADRSAAFGMLAHATGQYSSAYGYNAYATGDYSAAYGNGANASVAYGVALGAGSAADRQTTVTGVYVPTGASSTAVAATVKGDNGNYNGVASIGSAYATRQLAGVAAGIEDSDAVNVAQLKALDGVVVANTQKITSNDARITALDSLAVKYDEGTSGTSVTFGDGKIPVKLKNVADGDVSAADSKEAVNGGQLYATNRYIDAVSGDLGQKIGDISVKTELAVKYDDDTKKAVTFGDGNNLVKLKNVADAELSDSSTEAVTGRQLYAVSGDLNQKINDISVNTGFAVKYDDAAKTSVTFGDGTAPVRLKNVAAGTSETEAVNYGQLSELDAKVNTLGGTVAERMGGAYDQDTGKITVTYPSGPTPPSNIAAAPSGPAANEAIPGGDPTLNETLQKMWDSIQANSVTAGDNISVEGGKVSVVKNPEFESVRVGAVDITREGIDMGGKKITGLADGGIYNGSRDAVNGGQLWNAYNRIEELDNDIRVAGAHAAALSAMHPVAYNPYEPTTISAGYGYYRSEQSFAVGVFHYIRENVLVNAGMAFNSGGDTMGRAGVSFALGKSGRKQPSMIKDVNEMQKQMAAMQEMLMQLKEENEKNKEENRKNKEENRKNREIIKELKEALKEK